MLKLGVNLNENWLYWPKRVLLVGCVLGEIRLLLSTVAARTACSTFARNSQTLQNATKNKTRMPYVDQLMVVSLLQVMQNWSVVKISQVGHIFGFFVFRGVDLGDQFLLEVLFLFFRREEEISSVIVLDLRKSVCSNNAGANCAGRPLR